MLSEWRKTNFVSSRRIALRFLLLGARPATSIHTRFQNDRGRDCWTTALGRAEKKSLWGGPGHRILQKIENLLDPLCLYHPKLVISGPYIITWRKSPIFPSMLIGRVCMYVCIYICMFVCYSVSVLGVSVFIRSSSNVQGMILVEIVDRQWILV